MAQPFKIEESLKKLLYPHPSPEEFRVALANASIRSREHVVRLWLTEGVPFAFRDCPYAYEEIRRWLGTRLEVCPKEITVVGSVRIGFSMAKSPNYGHPFGTNSDLDLVVVSQKLFKEITDTFSKWKYEYTTGIVHPRTNKEREFWSQNLKFGEKNIPLGFFDVNKVPTFDRYPLIQNVQNTMWVLREKIKLTPKIPLPRRASLRIYATWQNLVERISFNLLTVLIIS